MTKKQIREGFANNLTTQMYDAKMTVQELSKETGLSVKTINRYLNGSSEPKLSDLENIANALCVSRYVLLVY